GLAGLRLREMLPRGRELGRSYAGCGESKSFLQGSPGRASLVRAPQGSAVGSDAPGRGSAGMDGAAGIEVGEDDANWKNAKVLDRRGRGELSQREMVEW